MRGILRESPATCGFCVAWAVVYVAMILHQRELVVAAPWANLLANGRISPVESHLFGDLTSSELYAGMLWRTVTATFVHYALLHILLNIYGMFQIGRVIEDLYGSKTFCLIYLVIAFFGNLFAGLLRPFSMGERAWMTQSGGGSTVLFGLVGLCAVYGWSSRTRVGDYILKQMIILLIMNGFLGLFFPVIDNLAHLGGAAAGAAMGLFQNLLARPLGRRIAEILGQISIGAIAAAVLIQVGFARRELALSEQLRLLDAEIAWRKVQLDTLKSLRVAYHEMFLLHERPARITVGAATGPIELARTVEITDETKEQALRLHMLEILRSLRILEAMPLPGGLTAAYERERALASRSLVKSPNPDELGEFERSFQTLNNRITEIVGEVTNEAGKAVSRLARPEPPAWAFRRAPANSAATAGEY